MSDERFPLDVVKLVDDLMDEAIAADHDVSTEQMMARAILAERNRVHKQLKGEGTA